MLNLLDFQKPQRYIGNELNVIKKDHTGKISFCLCYPNTYEVGMDNLGLRIIYGLLNSYSKIVCERLFLPGQDLLVFLEKNKIPLFSLETKTALDKFDLIGFNFGYELNYLNFLRMLSAGAVSPKSRQRKDIIVIGGGVANPEPLADFVDVFCLGEFEPVAGQLVEVLNSYPDKLNRLKALSRIKGFYVPHFYRSSFFANKYKLEKKDSQAIFPLKSVQVKNLNESFFPFNWLTPHTKLIQDRIPLEIARGCPNNCKFCQARNIYKPYREKSVETIVKTLKEAYLKTGYENFSLLSLSVSNYSHIEKLLTEITPFLQKNKIALSLPSLKIDKSLISIYRKLLPFQKTSLTVAVEAGRQELRQRLNKNIAIEQLFTFADTLYRFGLRLIKVYFMYGFPQEKEDDLKAIGAFVNQLLRKTRFNINVSLNLFIPKPHSQWENVSFLLPEEAKTKRDIILASTPRSRRLKVSTSNLDKSIIEAILARAGSEIAPVLVDLLKEERKMKENEIFSWPVWQAALNKHKVDWQRYLRADTENFPWSFIE